LTLRHIAKIAYFLIKKAKRPPQPTKEMGNDS
jgi:hypothetical protein